MNSVRKWPLRNVEQAVRVLDFGNDETTDDILKAFMTRRQRSKENPMEEDMSVSAHQRWMLCECQLNLDIPEPDVYHLRTIEPMHHLHLSISKQLKFVTPEKICSSALTSSARKNASGGCRNFSSIRRKLFDTTNSFLQHV